MTVPDLATLLDRFSRSQSGAELDDCAKTFIRGKLLAAARADHRFGLGLQRCFEITQPPVDRLKAIAAGYRLGATSKPVMSAVRSIAVAALSQELPPLQLLTDGDDRYYASLSTLDANYPWVAHYAANAIAHEDTVETARTNLAQRLFAELPLADGLRAVAQSLAELRFTTEKPHESVAKRLKRVIAAVRPAIVLRPISPGAELGSALRALFQSPFSTLGRGPDERTAQDIASECCALIYDVLRTQITVVADAAVYRALIPLRDWITPAYWPHFVASDSSVARVRSALEDAILLLAKQLVTDQALLECLTLLHASRSEAEHRLTEIANQHEELDPGVREWLTRFGRTRTTPRLSSMDAARDAHSDSAVAHLIVLAESLRLSLAEQDSTPDHLPRTASRDILIPQLRRILDEIGHLGAARQLTLFLRPGEAIEYSPHAHELLGGHTLGVRTVRVVQSGVERRSADGVTTIIRKAIVDKLVVKHE